MNLSDRIVATIRTGVPALVGLTLTWLIAQVPVVADVIAFIDSNLSLITEGVPVAELLSIAATAGVITAYYYLVRLAGTRWPAVEKWLLGKSLVPVYIPADSQVR